MSFLFFLGQAKMSVSSSASSCDDDTDSNQQRSAADHADAHLFSVLHVLYMVTQS
jgi:hypothetical protein